MNRRDFLTLATGASAGVWLHSNSWALSSPVKNQKLVVVMLRGAVDGLSILVPYSDSNYYQLRDQTAIAKPGADNGLIKLNSQFGLHPALAPLMPLWEQGQLSFIPASGSPDITRSHFDAQDYLESATPGRKTTPDGWLNRFLGQLPDANTEGRAINLGPTMPRILTGPQAVGSLGLGKSATRPSHLDRPRVASSFDALYKNDAALAAALSSAQLSRNEMQAALMNEMSDANNGAPLPDGFPADARRLAQLMRGNEQLQVAFLSLGGWDTHINQGNGSGQLANRLKPLGEGLLALAQGLGSQWQNTTVLVMSEFGRTAKENGSGGTDHGHGNVMWLLGGSTVGGQIHGQWPGLGSGSLYEGRDIAVTTDFRAVIAEILGAQFALNDRQLANILPNYAGGSHLGLFTKTASSKRG